MSTQDQQKAELVANIAREWNDAGIHYVVSHGIEHYPDSIGRDLDIHIDVNAIKPAIDIATRHLRAADYAVTLPPQPWNWRGRWIGAFKEGENITLDFIPYLIWGPVVLVGTPEPTRQIGPFPVDEWSEFAKRVMMYVLTGRLPKRPWDDLPDTPDIRVHCERLLGTELSNQLMAALQSGEDEQVKRLIKPIRRTVRWRGIVRHPLTILGMIRPWLSRQIKPHFSGIVPIIALVGPDGVGKTSTMNALEQQIPDPFLGLKRRHWRPRITPRLGAFLGKPAPKPDEFGKLPPRRKPGRFHTLRLLYYSFDYILGHYLRDKKDSSALYLVCYDRYAIDMMIDPIRYGLASKWGTRWLWNRVPRPDLVIMLYDDPESIFNRKDELPLDELNELLQSWLKLAESGDVDAIIQIDAPPEVIAARIVELLVDRFIEKYGVFTDSVNTKQWIDGVLATNAE